VLQPYLESLAAEEIWREGNGLVVEEAGGEN
jgi:hypothetical protein